MKVVAFDLEIINPIGGEFDWSRPWELGIGVACTYSPETGFRDFFGGGRTPDWDAADIQELATYLTQFDRVVSFNGEKFDCRVIDGYLDPPIFDRGPQHWRAGGPASRMQEYLQGRHIDMLADIYEITGRRCSLDALAYGMLGETKILDGATAPTMWQNGQRFEVIQYCRDDTRKTHEIYQKSLEQKRVAYIYRNRRTSVPVGKWKVR